MDFLECVCDQHKEYTKTVEMSQISPNSRKTFSERLKILAQSFRKHTKLYWAVAKDKGTPKISKLLLGLAVGYTFLPLDIIPDFIPVIGHLDDVIIIPLLVYLALKFIPKQVMDEHRLAVGL